LAVYSIDGLGDIIVDLPGILAIEKTYVVANSITTQYSSIVCEWEPLSLLPSKDYATLSSTMISLDVPNMTVDNIEIVDFTLTIQSAVYPTLTKSVTFKVDIRGNCVGATF
jgi:hypothetical protein